MTTEADRIRQDIDRRRDELSADVDALAEKVTPSRAVSRQVDHAKDTVNSLKDKVMGVAGDTGQHAHDALANAAAAVSGALPGGSSEGSGGASPAQAARKRAQGNPFAAGLIAFGAGWLLSSLLPASAVEQQAATALKDTLTDHAETLKAPLTEMAHHAAEELREPAHDAVEAVRSAATEAVEEVQHSGSEAGSDLTQATHQARDALSGADHGQDK